MHVLPECSGEEKKERKNTVNPPWLELVLISFSQQWVMLEFMFPDSWNFPHGNQLYTFTKWPEKKKKKKVSSCLVFEQDQTLSRDSSTSSLRGVGHSHQGEGSEEKVAKKKKKKASSVTKPAPTRGNKRFRTHPQSYPPEARSQNHPPVVESCWQWGEHRFISWHFPDCRTELPLDASENPPQMSPR